MAEAHQFQTMVDYARSIKGGPESAWPMVRLPEQVCQAVEQATKGEPKEAIQRRVRRAVRDVAFLFHLHQAFDSIKQRYFDGQPGLFPGSSHALSQLVELAENLVDLYNRNLAAGIELLDSAAGWSDAQGPENRHSIDLSNLLVNAHGAAEQAAYLADMAKAEALYAMGETECAVAMLDRHV